MAPKIVNHDEQRQLILEQAIALFVEQGYAGLGMRELAKALGMSKSALYHYFPSKEALFEAVVQAVVTADIAGFEEDAPQAAPLTDKITALLQHLALQEEHYKQDITILLEYARIRQNEAGTQDMQLAAQAYAQSIANYLGITRDEGWAFYLQFSGAMVQRVLDGGKTDLEQAMNGLVQLLIGKYGATPDSEESA
jgi:AcrR family transcriptional regulator